MRDNATLFKWDRIVGVFPRSIIHTERVKAEESYDKLKLAQAIFPPHLLRVNRSLVIS